MASGYDNFNRPDETLAGLWTRSRGSGAGAINVESNRARAAAGSSTDKFFCFRGAAKTPYQFAQVKIGNAVMDAGPAVRISGKDGAGPTGYWVSIFNSQFGFLLDGANTVDGPIGTTIVTGDTVRLEAREGGFFVFVNDVLAPNSPHLEGTIQGAGEGVGFFYFERLTGDYFEEWQGGDLVLPGRGFSRVSKRVMLGRP